MPPAEDIEILSFLVDWYDPLPQLKRRFLLKFYVQSHSVEMFDVKNKKLFLRKCAAPPHISKKDFFLGNKMTVYHRELELVECADGTTREKMTNASQRAFLLFTPECSSHWGRMLDFAQNAGSLSITDMRMIMLDDAHVSQWLMMTGKAGGGVGRSGRDALRSHLQSNPVLAVGLYGMDAVVKVEEVTTQLKSRFGVNDVECACMTVAVPQMSTLMTGGDASSSCDDPSGVISRAFETFFYNSSTSPSTSCYRRLPSTATYDSCTLCIIKPHSIKEGDAGKIIDVITSSGYDISAVESMRFDHAQASELLEVYRGVVPEFADQVEQLCSGMCLCLEVRAEDAVTTFRQTAGPWDVDMAKALRPQSIRGAYGKDRVFSAVHCTDLVEDGVKECEYVFNIVPSMLASGSR